MSLQYEDQTLAGNEALKSFENPDALAKSYLDLHTKVTGGSIELLPEDMRKDPTINRYKSITELAKGLVETQKMVGSIEKAPATPADYKWTALTDTHKALKQEEIQKALMPIAHMAGVGNKAADMFQQGLMKTLSTMLTQQEQARKESATKAETELRSEWGADYDAKFDKIMKTMALVGGADMTTDTAQISAALKGSPKFLKGMGKIISLLSEDSLRTLGEGADQPITDATAAQKAIDEYTKEIQATGGKHAYYADGADGNKARQKMMDLYALLQKK